MADRIATVYGGPLVRGLKTSPEDALRRLKSEVLRRVRSKLMQSTFSDRAKKSFSRALSVEIGPSSLTLVAKHPAFQFMIKGRAKRQMSWLVKARAPIPIITETGELIFRWATPRSMANGSWIHPGRAPFDFVDKAMAEAKLAIKQRILEEIRRTVKAATKSASRRT